MASPLQDERGRQRGRSAPGHAPTHSLPPLPYPAAALAPHVSERTVVIHHTKHEQHYVTTLNSLIEGTELSELSLPQLIETSAADARLGQVFNNAAQAWNHAFYWQSLSPKGGGSPPAALRQRIEESFGSVEKLTQQLIDVGTRQFGAGWVWLALDGALLKVMSTGNADTPLAHSLTPLLTIDVWEHAYYLDYQSERAAYLKALFAHRVNWEFAAENLERASAQPV
jgi:Fe-Mn family superoxide dismutase